MFAHQPQIPTSDNRPAHGGLDYAVQGLEIYRRAHSHAAPDQRLDILKFNAKDGDAVGIGHAGSLTASGFWHNQSPSGAQ